MTKKKITLEDIEKKLRELPPEIDFDDHLTPNLKQSLVIFVSFFSMAVCLYLINQMV